MRTDPAITGNGSGGRSDRELLEAAWLIVACVIIAFLGPWLHGTPL